MVSSVFLKEYVIPYSSHPKVAKDTTALASHYTPVLDLCVACVAVHLRELELGLRADSLWQSGIADNVSEGLSVSSSVLARHEGVEAHTVRAHSQSIPSALCGRGCCESLQSIQCRAWLRGIGT
jgi:hypothetical protein